MLRQAIMLVAVLLVAGALVLTVAVPAEWPLLAGTLLFACGCLFERRYARAGAAADARFRPTAERFVDPESGRVTTAWVDPITGERRYVDEGPPPGRAA